MTAMLKKNFLYVFSLLILSGTPLVLPASAGDWPAFRGPHNDGVASDEKAPVTWSMEEGVSWKVELPRPGNGSPVVAQGRVFVTSAENDEGTKRSLYCFDRKDGRQLWVATVEHRREMPTHQTNPYCGTTPLIADNKVVVWHGSAGLHCYDLDGHPVWRRDLGEFQHMWGYGTSPIHCQGQVVLNTGPGKQVFVAAFDLQTGETLWKIEEPVEGDGDRNDDGQYQGSWSSPIVTRVEGHEQILVALPTRLVAYDPDDGEVLWYCQGVRHDRGDLAYSSPVIVNDLCFYTGGFRGPMFATKLGGRGDVTASNRLWRKERQPQNVGTAIAVGNYVIRPNAGPGTLECVDPRDGSVVWTARAGGGNYWSSIVKGGDLLYATNQQGTTLVFKANAEKYEEVARNPLGDPSNATPAISDGNIFIRTSKYLWCIE